PFIAFLALAILHERVHVARGRAVQAHAYYERGLARIEDRWHESGPDGSAFRDERHLYDADLNLFGPGSLFQLVSAARTGAGERTLADWLKAPASIDVVRERQAAVRELAAKLDFRHDLAVLGPSARAAVDSATLGAWVGSSPLGFPSWLGPWSAALAIASAAALALAAAGAVSARVPLVILILVFVTGSMARAKVRTALTQVSAPSRELELVETLLSRIGAERFESSMLVGLLGRLLTQGTPPAIAVGRLRRLVAIDDSRRNQIFAPFAAALLVGTQIAVAIERWRVRYGPAVVDWIEVIGTVEALASLATRAYEQPDDVFAELVPAGPRFDAVGLGHPLLPSRTTMPNDLALGGSPELLVVSGSNMSGKSTLLRAVGLNAVLALAGGAVRSHALRISPLAIGASTVTRESLLDGRSRFYGEVLRLRDVLDLTKGDIPVLFLFDELLSGTNSHDRFIGARAVVRTLVQRGAIGLLTTHDLALTAIAEELGPRAANVHLEDQLVNGEMHFDYALKPGVVTRSNAIELMRSVGLEVEDGSGIENRE
ncbi:MAG: DNA mismatch repair protein MutS, partial [Gemmatimonadota bacterium]